MPQAFEGFNFDRDQNVQKSAKDSFAELANRAPTAPIEDKDALGKWFQQYIQSGMNQRGHHVSSVDGDKFTYGNHEGNFTVDYGRGAGMGGGALAWQAEGADDATRARYASPAPPPAAVAGRDRPIRTGPVRQGGSDLMTQILESLQEAQEPLDPQALLLQQLR